MTKALVPRDNKDVRDLSDENDIGPRDIRRPLLRTCPRVPHMGTSASQELARSGSPATEADRANDTETPDCERGRFGSYRVFDFAYGT